MVGSPAQAGVVHQRGRRATAGAGSPAQAGVHPRAASSLREGAQGSPAQAGVHPTLGQRRRPWPAAPPRRRGSTLALRFPTPNPDEGLPRAGGGPPRAGFLSVWFFVPTAPPRRRGSTRLGDAAKLAKGGSPAQAGVHPSDDPVDRPRRLPPRRRGSTPVPRAGGAPPRRRGSTPCRPAVTCRGAGSPRRRGSTLYPESTGPRSTAPPRRRGVPRSRFGASTRRCVAPPRRRGSTPP